MATKTVKTNTLEAAFKCESGDVYKLSIPHVDETQDDNDLMEAVNNLNLSFQDLLADAVTGIKYVSHVVSEKTYYGE